MQGSYLIWPFILQKIYHRPFIKVGKKFSSKYPTKGVKKAEFCAGSGPYTVQEGGGMGGGVLVDGNIREKKNNRIIIKGYFEMPFRIG